jgi:hypothetical protein
MRGPRLGQLSASPILFDVPSKLQRTILFVVAPLALCSRLRQRGCLVSSLAYPAFIPSSRAAELGNTLG